MPERERPAPRWLFHIAPSLPAAVHPPTPCPPAVLHCLSLALALALLEAHCLVRAVEAILEVGLRGFGVASRGRRRLLVRKVGLCLPVRKVRARVDRRGVLVVVRLELVLDLLAELGLHHLLELESLGLAPRLGRRRLLALLRHRRRVAQRARLGRRLATERGLRRGAVRGGVGRLSRVVHRLLAADLDRAVGAELVRLPRDLRVDRLDARPVGIDALCPADRRRLLVALANPVELALLDDAKRVAPVQLGR